MLITPQICWSAFETTHAHCRNVRAARQGQQYEQSLVTYKTRNVTDTDLNGRAGGPTLLLGHPARGIAPPATTISLRVRLPSAAAAAVSASPAAAQDLP